MNKRGRPNRISSFDDLFIAIQVLEICERLRLSTGLGRIKAIKQAVKEIKATNPKVVLSETAVKNILANYQPEKISLSFEAIKLGNWKKGVWKVEKVGDELVLKFGKRPPYPKRGQQKIRKNISYGRVKKA